jgi:dihydropyrimidinase
MASPGARPRAVRPETAGADGLGVGGHMRILIKGGTIVTAVDEYRGDVLVEGERISLVGTAIDFEADRVIDAAGKYVLPGGIDVHTHLDMPFGGTTSADDFESGTIAAAFGGTTSIVDFAIQYKGETLHHAWDTWMRKAEGKAAIDYGFHMIVTDLTEAVEDEMDALVRQGVTSFKLFMAYPGVFMQDDATIFRALLRTGKNGGTICMHAENGGVIDVLVKKALAEGRTAPKYHALTRPARAEAEATHRAIALAEMADVPIYIVHLSAAEALEMVTEARDRGLPAYAETCPQYLFLSYDNYEEPGFEGAKYVMSPPLRPKETQDRLWRGLAFNDLQAISTDHCPFCMKEQKVIGHDDFSKIPNGAPGIETRMSLVYDGGVRTGRISLNRFVELTSTSPAKIFGLFPRKGTIAPGSDADIVVFDPKKTVTLSVDTLHMKVDYNPYEGRQVTGATDTVISRGRVIIDQGRFTGRAGAGQFLARSPRIV